MSDPVTVAGYVTQPERVTDTRPDRVTVTRPDHVTGPLAQPNGTLTTTEVVTDVNAALASRDRGTILELARELNRHDTRGCPLD